MRIINPRLGFAAAIAAILFSVSAAAAPKARRPEAVANDRRVGLLRAAKSGDVPTLTDLLDKGADPNAADDDGRTALMWAANMGRAPVFPDAISGPGMAIHRMNIVQAGGAVENFGYDENDIANPFPKGTPDAYVAAAKLLLARGAAAGAVATFAANRQKLQAAGFQVGAAPSAKVTALDVALAGDSLELVKALLDGGGADARGALLGAKNLEWANYFADHGAELEYKDALGTTPLLSAARRGDAETAKFLVARGAAVDLADNAGDTPLMEAARKGNIRLALWLAEKGADLLATNKAGFTPADVARESHHQDLADMLSPSARRPRAETAAAAPAAAPKPPAPEAAAYRSDVDAPKFKTPERPDDWALVVGIENYHKHLPKADFAERDAEAVRKHLIALGVPEQNVVLLIGQDATQSALKSYLEDYLPKNVTAQSRVFFYYSGHGAPDPETGSAYLVPWEAEPQFIKSQGLPLEQLYGDLAKLKAKQVLIAMDSCFSGAGGRSVLKAGARPLVTVRTDASGLAPNMTLLAAAQGDQITGSLETQGHGMFTYYFLKGLDAGMRDSRSLFDYLKPGVEKAARRQNGIQEPLLKGAELKL